MMLKQYPVWLGLAVIVVIHFVGGGWWLDTGDRVRTMLTVLAAASFVVGITSPVTPRVTWLPGLHFWIGFTAGMVVILFLSGPGNIWPIVLAIGSGMAGMVIVVGFVSAVLVRMAIKAVTS